MSECGCGCYLVRRLEAESQLRHSFSTTLLVQVFPRFQTRLRRHVNGKSERRISVGAEDEDDALEAGYGEADLYQCHRTSRFSFEGVAEAVIELVGGSEATDRDRASDDEGAAIRVKVRGKRSAGKQCFLLLEEVLGIIDQVRLTCLGDDGPNTSI